MAYCVALSVDAGIVLMSDYRTNAGPDQVATYSKIQTWALDLPGDGATGMRAKTLIAVVHHGNMATAQKVRRLFDLELRGSTTKQRFGTPLLSEATSLFDVAARLGSIIQETVADTGRDKVPGVNFGTSFILAGKVGTERHRLFLIYQEGNFLEATPECPYLQLGTWFGKPILDQVVTNASSLSDCVQAALIAMETTVRCNITVGPPFDLAILSPRRSNWLLRVIKEDDQRYGALVRDWNEGARMLFATLPVAVNIDESETIDVFISYSSKDRTIAETLAGKLVRDGVNVWWDTELLAGQDFRREIIAKLEAARSVIVIWSSHSVKSAFVLDEADRARKQDKLVPIRLPELSVEQLPLGFGQLQTLQLQDHSALVRSLAALGVSADPN
jgi:putative proteasome-type protease